MKTLLICTDFSETAFHAAQYGGMLAREYQFQRITLLHAYQTIAPVTGLPTVTYDSNEIYNAAMEQLNDLKAQLTKLTGRDIMIHTRATDLILGENIDKICGEENSDLIVMGVTGKSAFEKTFIGSNAAKVSANSNYPVLIVPAGAPIQPVSRILLACDLNKVAETIPLDSLHTVLELFNAPLFILNVDNKDRHFSPQTPGEIEQLHHLFDKYKPQYAFTEHKDIVAGILDYAEKHDISLVIAIPKNYNFLAHLFHKSTTGKLVDRSQIPLLTLHE